MDHLNASEIQKLLMDEISTLGGIRQKVMEALQELKVEESWLRNRLGETGGWGNPHQDKGNALVEEVEGQHEEEKVEEAEELEDFLQELEGRLQTGEAGNVEGDEHMRDDVENEETGSAMITTE